MNIIDLHCDTIYELYRQRPQAEALRENTLHLDLLRMKKAGYLLQNFALYVDQSQTPDPLTAALEMADLYYEELAQNRDLILPARSYEEICQNQCQGKMSAMLTLEGGEILGGSLAMLRNFYRLGVRMIALTWNYENEIGAPNMLFDPDGIPQFFSRNAKGLTPFGIEAIQEMERLGILIDVSHLSDGGFEDVLRYTRKPFVASHSNAAAQCGVCRNLTDDMIRALAHRGGVMGLNFCTSFLDEAVAYEPDSSRLCSKISDMVRHIRHISDVGGIGVCALGSDFDGIQNKLEFGDASGLPLLADALKKEGFSESQIDDIFYRNALRVYRDVLTEER